MKLDCKKDLNLALLMGLVLLGACAKAKPAAVSPTPAQSSQETPATGTTSTTQTGSNVRVDGVQNGKITESTDRDLTDPSGYVYVCQGTIFNQHTGDKAENSVQKVPLNIGDETISFKKVIYQDSTHQILLDNEKGKLSLYTLNGDEDHQETYAGATLGAEMIRMDGFGSNFFSTVACRLQSVSKNSTITSFPVTGSTATATSTTATSTTPTTTTPKNGQQSVDPAPKNSNLSGVEVPTDTTTSDTLKSTTSTVAKTTGPKTQHYHCTGTLMNIDQSDKVTDDLSVSLNSDDDKRSRLFLNNTRYKLMIGSNLGHIQLELKRKVGHMKKVGTAQTDFTSSTLNFGIRDPGFGVDARVECEVSDGNS